MKHVGTIDIKTPRLILRRFARQDAEAVYRNWESDEQITRFLASPTPANPEETSSLINSWIELYSNPQYYRWAIELKSIHEPIGYIRGTISEYTDSVRIDACLGPSFRHQGIMTEAMNAAVSFFFDTVGASSLNAGHHPDNEAAGRTLRGCGFLLDGIRRGQGHCNLGIFDEVCYSILRPEYERGKQDPDRALWETLYEKAMSVLSPREISACIEAGGVAAALYTASRHIYTGVCIDTACTLGMCAERNAVANMITQGDQEILRIVAVGSGGQILSPCGACREMLMQLGQGAEKTQVLLSRDPWRVVTLGELLPDWWN